MKRYFFVAEFVKGKTLSQALEKASQDLALNIFSQCLEALHYMHHQGVFHCDLKPANILVTQGGTVKVIDFDVATRGTQVIGGTPPYFPPEILANPQIRPNARSDLYSMGVTLYHCLTSQRPFLSRSIRELKADHQNFHIPLPSEVKPELGTVWDGLLMGMMQKNPYQRYATASAILQQVHLLLGHKKVIFSEEDIHYRLNQHGVPIARDAVLEAAQQFLQIDKKNLEKEKRFLVLTGAAGLGTSYLLEEIKQSSQVEGMNCIVFNQYQQNYPDNFPFVWLIDDLSLLGAGKNQDRLLELAAKIREVVHKGEGQQWKILLGGIASLKDIPRDLRVFLQGHPEVLRLKAWEREDTQKWLEDLFQVKKIPEFLLNKIHDQGEGNPKRLAELLLTYLEKRILFDPKGHWRKDLLHPSPIFAKEFQAESAAEDRGFISQRFTAKERKLLQILSLLYEAASADFL